MPDQKQLRVELSVLFSRSEYLCCFQQGLSASADRFLGEIFKDISLYAAESVIRLVPQQRP